MKSSKGPKGRLDFKKTGRKRKGGINGEKNRKSPRGKRRADGFKNKPVFRGDEN